jgi:hypothetical protein
MRPLLLGIASGQGGLFARHQALSSGYTRREFEHMTRRRGGPWLRVRYGIYTERESWERLDESAQARLLDRAALISCDEGTVLSHSSAARALCLPLYDADDGEVHLTRLRIHDRILTGVEAGIKHHGGLLTDEEIQLVDGVPVTNAVRTTLDITSEFGYRAGLVTADAVLRSGVPKSELQAAVDRQPTHPHHAARQAVVADADGRAQTPIETLGRIIVKQMGITDVVPQQRFEFLDDADAFVDLYSPQLRHVFECDGKLKYRPQTNWRGEYLTAEEVVWLEKQREDLLRGRGLGVSRLIWADTWPQAFSRVSARLWREIKRQDAGGLFSTEGASAER